MSSETMTHSRFLMVVVSFTSLIGHILVFIPNTESFPHFSHGFVRLAASEDPFVRYAGLALLARSWLPPSDSILNSRHEKDDGDTDRRLRLLSGDTISPNLVTDVCSGDNSWIQSMVVRRALEDHEDPALQNSCIGSLAEHGTDYAVIVGAESLKSINQDFGALTKRILLCSESQSSDEIRRRAQELLSGRKR